MGIIRKSTLNGADHIEDIGSDGFATVIGSLPPTTPSRKGGLIRNNYALEPKQQFNPEQWGLDKYFNSNFRLSIDFNPGPLSPTERKRRGVNMFQYWTLSDSEKMAMGPEDGFYYLTESALHGEYEGAKYYESSLAEYEQWMYNRLPACGQGDANSGNPDRAAGVLATNIEVSNDWHKHNYGNGSHWPPYDGSKSVVCEFDGQTRTLDQIDQGNLWEVETATRRANRLVVMISIIKNRGYSGLRYGYGASCYQGVPRTSAIGGTGVFLDGACNVSHIGGDGSGNITLNGRNYTLTGNQFDHEDFMLDYFYLFNFDISRSDYDDIWVNKVSGTQNYPYLWGKIKPIHVVAQEIGHRQLCEQRMMTRQGKLRPIIRMIEPMYEANGAGIVDGHFVDDNGNGEISRTPFSELQNTNPDGSPGEKIWQPPYLNYSRYLLARHRAGNMPGYGFHVFPTNFDVVRVDLANTPRFNHHLHTLTALFQARHDMQRFEGWFSDSTFVDSLQIQIGESGDFLTYSGTEAYNYNDGVQGAQKPAGQARFKVEGSNTRVVVVFGMGQDWTTERTDQVKLPGLLNGCSMRLKTRGPGAHLFEFVVSNSDSNQVYEAVYSANLSWEKAGYGGRAS